MRPVIAAYCVLILCIFLSLAGCRGDTQIQEEYIDGGQPSDYWDLPSAKEAKKQNTKRSKSSNTSEHK